MKATTLKGEERMMRKIFYPAVTLMRRLDFKCRILLIGGAFTLPLLVNFYELDSFLRSDINTARQELKGSECLKPLLPPIQHLQEHRAASSGFLSGDVSFKSKMQQSQMEIADDIKAVDAVMAKFGNELKVKDKWEDIKQKWQTLRNQVEGLSPKESFERHSELIATVIFLRQDIADASKLSYEHNMDAWQLMMTTVQYSPEAIEKLEKARIKGAEALSNRKLSTEELAEMAVFASFHHIGLSE